jgi:hypothetical protein
VSYVHLCVCDKCIVYVTCVFVCCIVVVVLPLNITRLQFEIN